MLSECPGGPIRPSFYSAAWGIHCSQRRHRPRRHTPVGNDSQIRLYSQTAAGSGEEEQIWQMEGDVAREREREAEGEGRGCVGVVEIRRGRTEVREGRSSWRNIRKIKLKKWTDRSVDFGQT